MERNFLVRCNSCGHICPKDEIKIEKGNVEYCRDCGDVDCLIDWGRFGENSDNDVFPILSECRDWEQLKTHFDISTLCFFENEIHDYEHNQGEYSEADFDGCAFIIYWFEGSVDTKDLIEHYNII